MLKIVDDFLNGITMYRLMLYVLIALVAISEVLSFFGLLPFKPFSIIFSATFLVAVSWIANKVFARILKVPTNLESVYITALILTLIISPSQNLNDLGFLSSAAIFATLSKYILVWRRKHFFNPAALGIFATGIAFHYFASWWVANSWMVPFVALGGLLVVRKIRKEALVAAFFISVLTIILISTPQKAWLSTLQGYLLDYPLAFLAFIMLTEPQTTPPKRIWLLLYGSLAGVGSYYFAPETALIIGNTFSFLVSPKERLILYLKEKIKLSPNIYDFIFKYDKKFTFLPGQYLEWTLAHQNPDQRGVRRYFTIASSPTEDNIRIGVKFPPQSSSFKKSLLALKPGNKLLAAGPWGEFSLPEDKNQKLAFLAGGIGVTPFRSMIKYLSDNSEKRDVVLLFLNKNFSDIVYKGVFETALKKTNLKKVYALTDSENVPSSWKGRVGYIDAKVILSEVPDYKQRLFYISGPHSMVDTSIKILKNMGLPAKQIKEDFFPGYA